MTLHLPFLPLRKAGGPSAVVLSAVLNTDHKQLREERFSLAYRFQSREARSESKAETEEHCFLALILRLAQLVGTYSRPIRWWQYHNLCQVDNQD